MKNITKTLLAIICILAILLWFKSCKNEKSTTAVKIPAVSGEFEKQKPIYIIKKDTVYIAKWITKDRIMQVPTKNPVNDSLAEAYTKAKDSIDRFKLYISAIQIRDFSTHFEDGFLDLTIDGQVQGELKYIKPKYTVKERKLQAVNKEVVFRLLLGGQLQNNLEFNDFSYSANIGLQNQKGNILRAGYSKLNGQDYIMVGYDFSIFSIKK